MDRPITQFQKDDVGDWYAELSCGHAQHTRHNPPLESRPWVLDEAARSEKIGTTLNCVRCDRLELPDGYETYHTASFTDQTVPAALLDDHNTKPGVWGHLRCLKGSLVFLIESTRVELSEGDSVYIPSEIPHRIAVEPETAFEIDFMRRAST